MGVLIEGFMCIMFTNLPLYREPTSSSRPTRHRVATHHSSRANNTSNSSSSPVGHRALHSGTEWSLAVCSTNCNITRDHNFFSIM